MIAVKSSSAGVPPTVGEVVLLIPSTSTSVIGSTLEEYPRTQYGSGKAASTELLKASPPAAASSASVVLYNGFISCLPLGLIHCNENIGHAQAHAQPGCARVCGKAMIPLLLKQDWIPLKIQ